MKIGKKTGMILLFGFLCLTVLGMRPEETWAKTVSATISTDTVKLGRRMQITSTTKNVRYVSRDPSIAYVNSEGTVWTKNVGTTTILVKKDGYTTKKFRITVTNPSGKRQKMGAVPYEIGISDPTIKNGKFRVKVTNNGTGTVADIILTYSGKVQTGTKQVTQEDGTVTEKPVIKKITQTISFGKLKAGKTSKVKTCQAPADGEVTSMTLKSIRVVTGDVYSSCTYKADGTVKCSYGWATEDTTAPEITGYLSDNCKNGNDYYIVLYKDTYKDYDFSRYIHVTDNRDPNPTLSVDFGKVNFNKEGVYKVTFTAEDKSGNKTKAKTKVKVLKVGSLEKACDNILDDITKSGDSDKKVARAIYKYVKNNISYVGHAKKDSWRKAALRGIVNGYGDCFTYYALNRALLTRAGIANIRVKRNTTNPTHYWNMIDIGGGWYHVDSCRRTVSCYLFMLTDSQLHDFSNYHKRVRGRASNTWNSSQYPKSATKKVTKTWRYAS